MRVEQFIDPLYGRIGIDEPFASAILHPALQKEILRLKGIKSLGLVFHFFPAGTHTKWEHYLGMYHVAEQLQQGINTSENRELQWLCLLGGIGQLPCTHATATAVLLTAQVSTNFRGELRNLVRPASSICSHCDNKGICDSYGNYGNRPLDRMLEGCDPYALRGLLSAYKIKLLPKDVKIGDRDSLVRGCICPEHKLHQLYQVISMYDYMQRDLYHTGAAKFSIESKEVFSTLADGLDALGESPHIRLLSQLYNYLIDTLYLHPSVACMEALFSKVLAEKLCQGAISLKELLECSDDSLMHLEGLGDSLIATLTKRGPIFTIKRDIVVDLYKSANDFKLEAKLLGLKSGQLNDLLTYPNTYGVAVSVYNMEGLSEEFGPMYRIMLNVLEGNKKLYPIVAVASNLQRTMRWPMQTTAKLGQDILSYAFGNRKVSYSYETVESSLKALTEHLQNDELNKIIREVESLLSKYMEKHTEEEDILPPQFMRFWRILQHPLYKRRRTLRSEEVTTFWRRMVRGLMELPFLGDKGLRALWRPVISRVYDTAISQGGNGELIEALAYLAELTSIDRNTKMKWVLPSVFLSTDGNNKEKRNQVDVVSLSLLGNGVEIKLIECTESDSARKAREDYDKISKLKDMLDSQCFEDLTVHIRVVGSSQVGQDFVSIGSLF